MATKKRKVTYKPAQFGRKHAEELFKRFSAPFTQPCITSKQKASALGISMILWLLLISGTDTEENVYNALSDVFNNNHDSNICTGSFYFHKMKTELTENEIQGLIKYFSDPINMAEPELAFDHNISYNAISDM